jgi:hypothetical protein
LGKDFSEKFSKRKVRGVKKQNVVSNYVGRVGREMNKMVEKKESPLPMLVMLIMLGIAIIVLLRFILFEG